MYKRLKYKTFTVTENKQSKKRQFIKKMTQMTGLNLLFQKSVFTKKNKKEKKFIY